MLVFVLIAKSSKNTIVNICLRHVIVVVLFATAKISPLIHAGIVNNILPHIIALVKINEPNAVIVRDKPACQIQEIVSGVIQLRNILASSQNIVDNQGFLSFRQRLNHIFLSFTYIVYQIVGKKSITYKPFVFISRRTCHLQ